MQPFTQLDGHPPAGKAGQMIRERDWSTSPLGPRECWPPPLQTLVEVMLGSAQPMFVV